MHLPARLTRFILVAAASAGFAASTGTAVASPCDNALERRSADAPGGETTQVDENRPAGAGHGRKIG